MHVTRALRVTRRDQALRCVTKRYEAWRVTKRYASWRRGILCCHWLARALERMGRISTSDPMLQRKNNLLFTKPLRRIQKWWAAAQQWRVYPIHVVPSRMRTSWQTCWRNGKALLPLFAELEWIARKSGADLMVRVSEKIVLSCITYHAPTAILPT